MNDSRTPVTLEKIWEVVCENRPILKKILDSSGDESLSTYFKKSVHSAVQIDSTRRQELLNVVDKLLTPLLPKEAVQSALDQLANTGYVSTADHHGPITHPFFSNSALMHSFAYRDTGYENVIVFPCAGISLDNSSFPRGFLMHDSSLTEVRIPLVSRKEYYAPVIAHASYTKKDCERVENTILESILSQEVKECFLKEILPMYQNEEVLSLATYSEQMTRTNFYLWKKIPGQEKTNLIYLPQETIVSELILSYHLSENTDIRSLLFDPAWHNEFARHFDSVTGAFSTKEGKGTFLFWRIENGKRRALSQKDMDSYTPERIRKELADRSLIPSMALTFIVLCFYYGLHAGGGFSQVNYLTDMKRAYTDMLSTLGLIKEYPYLPDVDTEFFCGEFILAIITNGKKIVPATPYDLLMYGSRDIESMLMTYANSVSLHDAMTGILPELYYITVGGSIGKDSLNEYTLPHEAVSTVSVLRK